MKSGITKQEKQCYTKVHIYDIVSHTIKNFFLFFYLGRKRGFSAVSQTFVFTIILKK